MSEWSGIGDIVRVRGVRWKPRAERASGIGVLELLDEETNEAALYG